MSTHVLNAERLPKSCSPQIIMCLVARSVFAGYLPENYFGISVNPAIRSASSLARAFKGSPTHLSNVESLPRY